MSETAHGGLHTHGDASRQAGVAFFLNLGFAIFELISGLLINSVSILSDAVHDFGDCLSLGLAWYLERFAGRKGSHTFTYGYRRYSLLGAFINSVVLIAGVLFILSEAIPRLMAPEPFDAPGMAVVAVIGIIVNGYAALRVRGSGAINLQVIGWHLLEDVLGWAAVLIVALVSLFVDLPILDPILSILIVIYILSNAVRNLYKTAILFLQRAPPGVDVAKIEQELREIDGVKSSHHMHIWSLDGEHNVISTHLVVDEDATREQVADIKRQVRALAQELHPEHVTIEIEYGERDCSMADHEMASTSPPA